MVWVWWNVILVELRQVTEEALGLGHTRWCGYGVTPRCLRLDVFYVSHTDRWLAGVQNVLHNTENNLSNHISFSTLVDLAAMSNHISISTLVDLATMYCADDKLSLVGLTTFKCKLSLLCKVQVLIYIQKIWHKLHKRRDEPCILYHRGMSQVQQFISAKQREQWNKFPYPC